MTSLLPLIFITVFTIMLASLAGVVFSWKFFERWLQPRMRYVVAFAMGIFIMIVYGLTKEVLHEGLTFGTAAMFLLGAVLLEIATMLLPKDSHHHHHGSCSTETHSIDARRVLLGDAIHNIHDGLVLVPAFLVSPVVGIATATGVFLHEIVQEIAEFFILREAGYSTKKALIWNFLVSTTILIGVAFSLWFIAALPVTDLLIALSAGGFSYIIVRDIGPSVYHAAKKTGNYMPYGIAIIAGSLLMFSLTTLLPHEHHDSHGEDVFPLPQGFELVLTVVSPVQV